MRENGYRAFWLFAADDVHQTRIFRDGGAQFQLGGLRLKTCAETRICWVGGLGGIFLQKILKSRGSEMVFSTFSMRYFTKKSQPG